MGGFPGAEVLVFEGLFLGVLVFLAVVRSL